jgi:hypothetical protein
MTPLKTYVNCDDGQTYAIDTIQYEGEFWLVPEWIATTSHRSCDYNRGAGPRLEAEHDLQQRSERAQLIGVITGLSARRAMRLRHRAG